MQILDRYFLNTFFSKLVPILLVLSIFMAWSSAQVASTIIAKIWLTILCLPYAMYLLLPLVIAISWLQAKKYFINSGEWLSMFLHGWRPRTTFVKIVVMVSVMLLSLQYLSQCQFVTSYQTKFINTSEVLITHDKLLLKTQAGNLLLTPTHNKFVVTEVSNESKLTQTVYAKESTKPKYQLEVAHANMPAITTKFKLVYYEYLAMFCLLCLLLYFVVVMPITSGQLPIFYSMLASLILYTANLQTMHWLHKLQLNEALAPISCLLIMLIFKRSASVN